MIFHTHRRCPQITYLHRVNNVSTSRGSLRQRFKTSSQSAKTFILRNKHENSRLFVLLRDIFEQCLNRIFDVARDKLRYRITHFNVKTKQAAPKLRGCYCKTADSDPSKRLRNSTTLIHVTAGGILKMNSGANKITSNSEIQLKLLCSSQ